MSYKISENQIYDGKSYYYDPNKEPVSFAVGPTEQVDCLKRLQMELAYKKYYTENDLKIFLDENGLSWADTYDKNLHETQLLKTVLAVLQSLSNDISLYMRIETNFLGSRGEAFSSLQKRIGDMKKRIKEIEDGKKKKKSDFSFMFYTHELPDNE